MKKRKKLLSAGAEVNMTPMLDIVFIMLIFFIVSTTFITESGLDTTQQQSNNDSSVEKHRPIVVRICGAKRIDIDSRPIDVRAVRANVERKLAEFPQSAVVVQSVASAPTGTMVAVMDQARAARAPVSIAASAATCNESPGI